MKRRTLCIEINESSYWLLSSLSAMETMTPEEFVEDLIDSKLEERIAKDPYIKDKVETISCLVN